MTYAYFDERRTCSLVGRLIATLALGFMVHAVTLLPAEAHGGAHGFGRAYSSFGSRGAHFAADRRHGNDQYIRASSNDLDKLLATKLKSICHGC